MARNRRGSRYDPEVVDTLDAWAADAEWWSRLYGEDALAQLSAEEPEDRIVRGRIERHPVLTLTIIGQIAIFAGIARTAAVHHERLDGKGYPWGYSEQLGLEDRILAVADIYEALTAHRPYREGIATERALGILKELAGSALDPELVEVMAELAVAEGVPGPPGPMLIGPEPRNRRHAPGEGAGEPRTPVRGFDSPG